MDTKTNNSDFLHPIDKIITYREHFEIKFYKFLVETIKVSIFGKNKNI